MSRTTSINWLGIPFLSSAATFVLLTATTPAAQPDSAAKPSPTRRLLPGHPTNSRYVTDSTKGSDGSSKAVSPSISATNVVRQQGNSFCDSDGPFFGLGASYFQGLHDTKYNRPRLDHNLALLAAKGFNYVRILSMVSWDGLEIAPVTSNEPIGPGSSVGAESDPIKLCSAAAFAYLASLPGYVFHSRAGIYGFEKCCPLGGGELRFEHSAGIDAFRHLRQILPPDLANWTRNLSVANFASGNAYSRITTKPGRLDHHAGAPYENLFTQIVVTERAHDLLMCGGNRPDEPNSGARTTFWNIRALKHNFPANRKPDKSPQINIIGLDKWPGEKAEMGAWIEQWPGETTFPPNLYEAQKVRRFLLSRN
jgi:hypothetical protein